MESLTLFYQQEPFLSYTLLASILLFAVSFLSGLRRLDVISVFSPKGLFHITIAALTALTIFLLAENYISLNSFDSKAISLGLSRLPLYIIALAYGPSAGLLVGALFLALGNLLSFPELILLLELVVLGWFAISPSPRKFFWAGPLNILFAYLITWAAAGSAFLEWQSKLGADLNAHIALHTSLGLGSSFALLAAFFLPPIVYRRVFDESHIAPKETIHPEQAQRPTQDSFTLPSLSSSLDSDSRTLSDLELLDAFILKKPSKRKNRTLEPLDIAGMTQNSSINRNPKALESGYKQN